jgi:hypothetical protein
VKIRVDLPDSLLNEAKRVAAETATTVTALVEAGLRREIADARSNPFRLRDASFRGKGLRPRVANWPWGQIRALSYGDPD